MLVRSTVLCLAGVVGSLWGLLSQLDAGIWEKSPWAIMTFCFASALVAVYARANKKQDEAIAAKNQTIAAIESERDAVARENGLLREKLATLEGRSTLSGSRDE